MGLKAARPPAVVTWNPRSTGYGVELSVNVCPPHVASFSMRVTTAPFLGAARGEVRQDEQRVRKSKLIDWGS